MNPQPTLPGGWRAWRSSLLLRLGVLVGLVVATSCLGLGLAAFHSQRLGKRLEVEHTGLLAAEQIAESTALSLWNTDRDAVRSSVLATMRDRRISGVVVRDGNAPVVGLGRDQAWRVVEATAPTGDGSCSRPIIAHGQTIGQVQVWTTERFVITDLLAMGWAAAGLLALHGAVLIGMLVLALWLWLLRPLRRLADSLHQRARAVAEGRIAEATATVPNGGPAELAMITTAVNTLLPEVRHGQARLQAAVDQATAALRLARDEAERANGAKSAFLATMTHELRTPLTAALGYAELAQQQAEGAGHDGITRDLQRVRQSGEHLLSLISNILDFSKIESGAMEAHLAPVRLADLIEEVRAAALPLAQRHRNQLLIEDRSAGETILSDAVKLRQILLNLLANAAKYTQDGIISLSASLVPAPEGERQLLLQVRDTGIGMSQESIEQLFQPFRQVDAEAARRFGGTGLGLALSRRLAQLLDGDITVASKPGLGTCFTVALDLGRSVQRPPPPPLPAPAAAKPLVLICDDDPAVCELLSRALSERGWLTAEAHAADSAIALARRHLPAAILLDISLGGGLTGYDLLRVLRADPATAAIPTLVVTATDRRPPDDLAVETLLSKPLDLPAILAAVDRVTGRPTTLAAPRPPPSPAPPPMGGHHRGRPLVLVIEDIPELAELVERRLADEGYGVLIASSCAAAEAALASDPDLALVDRSLPDGDGVDLLRRLRTLSPRLGLVMLTGMATTEDRDAALAAGADVFATKPIDFNNLLGVLARLARRTSLHPVHT